MKLLNLRTLGILVLNVLRGDWDWMIGNHPVNVTVCGDYLEQFDAKGQFLELDTDAKFQAFRCPLDILDMNVAFGLREADQAVILDGRDEDHLQEGHQFQVLDTGIPTI